MFLSYFCCAPTECATLLINETTHHQVFNIPTRRNFDMILKDWKEKNASLITAKYEYWRIIFTLLMDEESMDGRQFWGLFKHRLEAFRKIKFKIEY